MNSKSFENIENLKRENETEINKKNLLSFNNDLENIKMFNHETDIHKKHNDKLKKNSKKLSILLISDFFFPKVGGVEVHIYQLAVSLHRLGCKVCVLTHSRKDRQGVKIMGNGFKVFFNPQVSLYDDCAMPILYGLLRTLRKIVISEKIDVIHCHQSTSPTCLESLMHASVLGVHSVLTDHSLYGFGQLHEVNINKVIRCVLCNVDQLISVSNIARENLMLRTIIEPNRFNTIPNGIDNTRFRPKDKKEQLKDELGKLSDDEYNNILKSKASVKFFEDINNENNITDTTNKINNNSINNCSLNLGLRNKNFSSSNIAEDTKSLDNNNINSNNNNKNLCHTRKLPLLHTLVPKTSLIRPLTIVSISRQAYRKGTDFLISVIPEICKLYENVNFIIGGDGPKKPLLSNMVEIGNLSSRVKLTGALPHNKVASFMSKGQIYLNTSLTESFCIAIVEAASTGLYTIATDVGGVGEVLPEFLVKLVQPKKECIINGIIETIENFDKIKERMISGLLNMKGWKEKEDESNKISNNIDTKNNLNNYLNNNFTNTNTNYKFLKKVYNWDLVAKKTILVYEKAMNQKDISFRTKIKKALGCGGLSGIFYLCLFLVDVFLLIIYSLFEPLDTNKQIKKKEFKYDNYVKYLTERKMKIKQK